MTEAFEIGVSLALQDGVSDAVGKARRDVASLEHAVRESGVSLRALHSAGTRAASVSFADAGQQDGDGAGRRIRPAAETGEKAASAAVPASALLGAAEAAEPANGEGQGQAAGIGIMAADDHGRQRSEVAFGDFTQPADVVSRMREPSSDRNAPADPDHDTTFALSAGHAPPGSGVGDFAAVPRAAAGDTGSTTRDTAALPDYARDSAMGRKAGAPEYASTEGGETGGVAAPISLVRALVFSGGAADTGRHDPQTSSAEASTGDDVQPGPMRQASFPDAGVAAAAPAEAGGQVAQNAREGGAGPREGDVFLDGMLVGRWMSRFLNREAERASAGPTGFDARRGRLLPGVTVGG